MPIHDWSQVNPGVFHAFHNTWLSTLQTSLNSGLLPDDHYALCDQQAGDVAPDVLTLQHSSENGFHGDDASEDGGVATLTQTVPRVAVVQQLEEDLYARRQKSLVIRHSSEDRIVAIVEIVSPGNKSSNAEFRRFIDKATSALRKGIHLLIVDLFPPGNRDPHGMHAAIWSELGGEYVPPASKRLTQVSYSASFKITAFVEPLATGDALMDMPLFLTPTAWLPTPLQATYDLAYRGVPRRFREVLDRSLNS